MFMCVLPHSLRKTYLCTKVIVWTAKATDILLQFTCYAVSKLRGGVPSAIETHVGALIQVHVGVTKETFGHTFHVPRHLIGQLHGRHFQIHANLGAGVNLRDVESIFLSWRQRTDEPLNAHANSACDETNKTRKKWTCPVCLPCCQRRSSLGCWVRAWWKTRSGSSRCRAPRTAPACLGWACESCRDSYNPWGCPAQLVDGTGVEDERAPG